MLRFRFFWFVLPWTVLCAQSKDNSFISKIGFHFSKSEYDSVLYFYEKLPPDSADSDAFPLAVNLAAKSYYYIGKNNASIDTYQRFFNNPPRDSAILAKACCSYSEVLIETSQYEEAAVQLSRAGMILDRIPHPDLSALWYNNRGVLFLRKNEYISALNNFDKAHAIARKLNDPTLLSLILNNIGTVYCETGEFRNALAAYNECLKIDLEFQNPKDLAVDYLNIATVYCELNDLSTSIEYFQKAKDAYISLKDSAGISMVLGNLSTVFTDMKKYIQAEKTLREAIRLARLSNDRLGETEWLFSLALIHYERGNYQKALVELSQVADRFERLENYTEYGKTLIQMGKCQEKLLNYADAERLLKLAFLNYESKSLKKELWRVESSLAKLYISMNRYREADSLFTSAVTRLENTREELSSDLTTYFIEHDRLDVYRHYVSFLIKQGRFETALEFFEKAKARNLADLMAQNGLNDSTVTSQKDSNVILEFFLHETGSFVFIKKGFDLKVYPIGNIETIRILTVEYLSQIKQKKKDRNAFLKLSEKLYREIWKPLEPEIRNTHNVIIIPDEILFYLPFESLFDGDQFTVERYEISYAPSSNIRRAGRSENILHQEDFISAFYQIRYPNVSPASPALANLPYIASEIDQIKKIFKDRVAEYSDQNATFQNLTDAGKIKSTILHLAAHAVNQPDKPLQSAIHLFLPDSSSDGRLTVEKIQKMRFDDRIVVLSACETSLGHLLKGEGMLGLTRAFMIAGASNVVSSMWRVYDQSTSEFMRRFYENRKNAKSSVSGALRAVKIGMIQSEEWNDPVYWAPFVLWKVMN